MNIKFIQELIYVKNRFSRGVFPLFRHNVKVISVFLKSSSTSNMEKNKLQVAIETTLSH